MMSSTRRLERKAERERDREFTVVIDAAFAIREQLVAELAALDETARAARLAEYADVRRDLEAHGWTAPLSNDAVLAAAFDLAFTEEGERRYPRLRELRTQSRAFARD